MSSRVLVVVGAAIAAAAVAVPVLAQSPGTGQTITFRELEKGSRFAYVDNAPQNKPNRRPILSIGDQFVFANPIVGAPGGKGELRVTCVITKRAPASDVGFAKGHPFCTGAFVLKSGTLFAQATDVGGKVTRGAIVGGTGAYAGARGTFTTTDTKTGANDVVTLQP